MKFSLSWLKRHFDTSYPLEILVEKLTDLGLEVENVSNPGDVLRSFKIASIVKTEPHPQADKLRLCHVDTGDGTLQVLVCGASNARPDIKVVFAPLGAFIPELKDVLKPAVIRGIESRGMLCSKRELGLGDDIPGTIWELETNAPVGQSLATYLELLDPVVEIGLTPNRGDCLGIRGIARELAAAGLGSLRALPSSHFEITPLSSLPIRLSFDKKTENACPHFTGRLIQGVKNGPSPLWLQNALRGLGMKSISALVDITNFFSQDLCRPLHVFDADKLQGSLTVRLSKAGETFLALDGSTYTLDDTMTVVADDRNVVALGGVMGGLESGCTLETTSVFLEAAYFDPVRTAQTGRKLGILSDARYRFERGIDPESTRPGLDLATQMILDLCGGIAGPVSEVGTPPSLSREIVFPIARVPSLTAIPTTFEEARNILESLGCSTSPVTENTLHVVPPSWRHDLSIPEDLVEEVTRVKGLSSIPVLQLPNVTKTEDPLTPLQKRAILARHLLVQRHMMETVSWSMVNHQAFTLFGGESQTLRIVNPITEELEWMRPSLLPLLLQAAKRNLMREKQSLNLFEVGPLYRGTRAEDQETVACGIRCGSLLEDHWTHEERSYDVFDVKNDVFSLLKAFDVIPEKIQIDTKDVPSWMHPHRSARLCLGPKITLGYFGEIHPFILKTLGLKGSVMAFEVGLSKVPFSRTSTANRGPVVLWPLQPIEKDLAFIVDHTLPAKNLMDTVLKAGRPLVTMVNLFDLYEGDSIGNNKKSMALRLKIQPQESTLTDQDIQDIFQKIVQTVQKDLGGILRDGQ